MHLRGEGIVLQLQLQLGSIPCSSLPVPEKRTRLSNIYIACSNKFTLYLEFTAKLPIYIASLVLKIWLTEKLVCEKDGYN